MTQVRHRKASGRLDEAWEFDPVRGVVDVVLRQGSAEPVAFTLPVCPIDKPRLGAFAISRFDGESWRVLPTRFIYAGGRLVHHEEPIHEAIGGRAQLVLTHAPPDVDAELEVMCL